MARKRFDILTFDTTHKLVVLCFTVLVHEYKEVFTEELRYFANMVDPTLFHRQIVVLTDEDYDYGRMMLLKRYL